MIDAITWFIKLKTNVPIFTFVDNNWLLIFLFMAVLKGIAVITPWSGDNKIYTLLDTWLKEVRGVGSKAAVVTVQAAKATGSAVAKKWPKKGDPTRAAHDH